MARMVATNTTVDLEGLLEFARPRHQCAGIAARREREEREAAERAARGEAYTPAGDVPTDADIAAQAEQAAAEAPVEVAKPVVQGSAFSRATSRAKVARGKIVDLGKLAAHFVEQKDEDFIAYLQKRVDGAYRVKLTLPGTEADNG